MIQIIAEIISSTPIVLLSLVSLITGIGCITGWLVRDINANGWWG